MSNVKYYIDIKDKKIPIIIRNFKNSNKLSIYFKNDILNVSKPAFMRYNELIKNIKQNETEIYKQYIKIKSPKKLDNKIMYKGKFLDLEIKFRTDNLTSVEILENKIILYIFQNLDEYTKKQYIKKTLIENFKNETTLLINERLPKISINSNIKYSYFTIRDALTRFGSCNVKNNSLHFSARLIMLPDDIVDAVIIHELCHIVHPNHSKSFYNLIKKYKPDYDECDKYLKENSKYINFENYI